MTKIARERSFVCLEEELTIRGKAKTLGSTVATRRRWRRVRIILLDEYRVFSAKEEEEEEKELQQLRICPLHDA